MKISLKLVGAAALVAVLALGGLAFAYWTQGGSGSGTSTAGTTTAITVHQTGSPTGLYPGATPTALSGTFDNPNSGPVTISSVTAAVQAFTSSLVDGTKPACTQADFQIAGTSGSAVIPAGNGVGSWSGLTVQLLNGAGNQNNCKNVSITINYTANP